MGAYYLLQGLRLLTRHGLRRFVLLPLAVNTLLFALLIWVVLEQFQRFQLWLVTLLPSWLHWLEWLLWPLFVLGVATGVLYTFTLVANLIGAPFNGLLAEAVERHLTGKAPPPGDGLGSLVRDVPRSLLQELRKLLYFVRWAVPLLLLFLVPGLNVAAPVLWLLFSAWMLAVEYLDYPMGNHGLRFSEQRRRLRRSPVLVLSFGGALLLLMLIPVVNFLAMPAGVAGATALWAGKLGPLAEK
jgi:CysZ protein